jgi:hypothetical protein
MKGGDVETEGGCGSECMQVMGNDLSVMEERQTLLPVQCPLSQLSCSMMT